MTAPISRPLNRRHFLRGAGTLLALPLLCRPTALAAPLPLVRPKRVVCVAVHLSLYPGAWFPQQAGREFELPPLLQSLAHRRHQFTLFSGMENPGVARGHDGEPAFLSGFNRAESLDQRIAREMPAETRFRSLQLASSTYQGASATSWNRNGLPLMGEGRSDHVFRQLFVDPSDAAAAEAALIRGQSVLDGIHADARFASRAWAAEDRERLDALMTSVREVELKVEREREWVHRPKPKVPPFERRPSTYHENLERIFDLAALSLQTDSTRVLSIRLNGGGLPIEVSGRAFGSDYHGLSHHGKDPGTVAELLQVEQAHMATFARFVDRLAATPEGEGTLLDHTLILFGSGLGNGSSHSTHFLPVMVLGGGFKHGQHIALKPGTPLCDLYVTMMQKLGIEADQFGSSRSNLNAVFARSWPAVWWRDTSAPAPRWRRRNSWMRCGRSSRSTALHATAKKSRRRTCAWIR